MDIQEEIKKKDRLSYRLVRLILLITILPIIFYYIGNTLRLDHLLRQNAATQLKMIARNLANNITKWDDRTSLALVNLVSLPSVRTMIPEKQLPAMTITGDIYSFYGVTSLNLKGDAIARRDGKKLKNYAKRTWFTGALSGNEVSRQALISKSTGKAALVYAAPILNEEDKIHGVLNVSTFLTELSRMVEATQIGKTGFAYCINQKGEVLSHPKIKVTNQKGKLKNFSKYPAASKALKLKKNEELYFSFKDENNQEWLAYSISILNGWKVIIQQQEDEVLAQGHEFLIIGFVFYLLLILFIVVLIWKNSHQFVRPIINMLEPIKKIGAGDWKQRVQIEREDEVGLLGQSFNNMAKQLGEVLSTLESKVEERTKLLRYSNQELVIIQKKLQDSIKYSSLIQRSILPNLDQVHKRIVDHFVIWKPKDIVGGDSYMYFTIEDKIIISVIDCTGHGVPGAFMSMMIKSELETIVRREHIHEPAKILVELSSRVQHLLQQDKKTTSSNAGLEASFALFDFKKNELIYSASDMYFLYKTKDDLIFIRGDRQSLGHKDSDINFHYKKHQIDLKNGGYFYFASDGITDQLGGPNDQMLGRKSVTNFITKNHHLKFVDQKNKLLDFISDYRSKEEQTDDITVFAIKISAD